MAGHRVTAPSLRMNRRELRVRVQNHRQTHKSITSHCWIPRDENRQDSPRTRGSRTIFILSDRHSKNCHGLSATTNFCMNGPMSFRGGRAALAQFISIWAGVNIDVRTTPSGLAAKA
jgi:hypothetical protein